MITIRVNVSKEETYLNLLLVKRLTTVIKKLLQVLVKVLEDESELAVGVQYIHQADNIRVLELLKQCNLTNGSRWDTFIL